MGVRVPRNPIPVAALITLAPYSRGWGPIPEGNKTPAAKHSPPFSLSLPPTFRSAPLVEAPPLLKRRGDSGWRFSLHSFSTLFSSPSLPSLAVAGDCTSVAIYSIVEVFSRLLKGFPTFCVSFRQCLREFEVRMSACECLWVHVSACECLSD